MDQNVNSNIDIIMCVDMTGSMHYLYDELLDNSYSFYQYFLSNLNKEVKVNKLRVKLIFFKDYRYDDNPMMETRFFTLPLENEAFKDAIINAKRPCGGGDIPECSLHALYYALQSKWEASSINDRQIIVLMSDTESLPLDVDRDYSFIPKEIPTSLDDIKDMFKGNKRTNETFNPDNARLLMVVPSGYPWVDLSTMNHSYLFTVSPGMGLQDIPIKQIIILIASLVGM